jgi:hypothetical protein
MFNKYVFNGKYKNGPFFYSNIAYDEPDIPRSLSANAAHLIASLLEKKPIERLGGDGRGAQSVKEHPFFNVSSFPISVIV